MRPRRRVHWSLALSVGLLVEQAMRPLLSMEEFGAAPRDAVAELGHP